jgi:hypothetical protein
MHGSLEQVHIKARQKRLTILQIAQEGGQVLVNRRSTGSSRSIKKILDHATSTEAATPSHTKSAGIRSVVIHLPHDSRVVTVLVVERAEEGHTYPVQHPVYFISEVLGRSKKKYPQVQKLLYAVLLTARKLVTTLTTTKS